MPTSTYEKIETYTVSGSSTSTYTFTSIPATYTDLIFIGTGSTSTDLDLNGRINGDTGSNYSRTALSGNGTAGVSARSSNLAYFRYNYDGYWTSGAKSTFIAHFMNYSNSTTYKTFLTEANNTTTGVDMQVSLWRSTAAINSIQIYLSSGNFVAGTTFTLYGIKAA